MGFVQMDTDEVTAAMGTLSTVGESLGAAWGADHGTITGHEAGIGTDVLGQAFRMVYRAPSQATAAAADRVGPAIVADAEVATRSATEYAAADSSGAEAIGRSGRGGARAL